MSDPDPPQDAQPSVEESAAADVINNLARKVVFAVVFGAMVFAAIALYSDVEALWLTAQGFAVDALLAGFALAAGNYALRILRWHYYLRRLDIEVPVGESALIFLSGFVMSVTPGKVGEVFKSLLLYESHRISIARSAPIVVAERLTDLLALVMLIAAGSLAFEHGAAIAMSGGLFVAVLLVVCVYRPLGERCLDLVERLPLVGRFGRKLREAYGALLEMTRPAPLLLGTTVAFVAWAMECASLYVIVHGFAGARMSWDAATFTYATSTMAGAVALLPGGPGVTEIGMTALLQSLGGDSISAPVAVATTILVRIATLWFAVVIGMAALALHRVTRTRSDG